jgi:hypothetical protein
MFREKTVDMWVKADNIWCDDSTNLKSGLQGTNQAKHDNYSCPRVLRSDQHLSKKEMDSTHRSYSIEKQTMHLAWVDKLKHLARLSSDSKILKKDQMTGY